MKRGTKMRFNLLHSITRKKKEQKRNSGIDTEALREAHVKSSKLFDKNSINY